MFCEKVKEYLSQKGVQFQEKDVVQDPSAFADLRELGYMATPVTVINGLVVVGFDIAKIDAALI